MRSLYVNDFSLTCFDLKIHIVKFIIVSDYLRRNILTVRTIV